MLFECFISRLIQTQSEHLIASCSLHSSTTLKTLRLTLRCVTHTVLVYLLSHHKQIWKHTWMAHYTILLRSCQRQQHITLSFLCHVHAHPFIFVSCFLSHRGSWSMCLSDTLSWYSFSLSVGCDVLATCPVCFKWTVHQIGIISQGVAVASFFT